MCNCVGVEIGSYSAQVLMDAPPHMPKANGYCIDMCLADEIKSLWGYGITTTGCCCGHNKRVGFIGVAFEDIQKMKNLGYAVARNELRPGDEDSFVPKSVSYV